MILIFNMTNTFIINIFIMTNIFIINMLLRKLSPYIIEKKDIKI